MGRHGLLVNKEEPDPKGDPALAVVPGKLRTPL